ncbi:MAG TPA: hypothetical protein VK503_08255, partial [Candidatus Bathyarchaeia archaeon]|nr:hypothetical protein [Candidatus Bathyarchaeia archaeon]
MVSRRLYQIIGIVTGFALIDYGFNFMTVSLPGARQMTSQFVGANLLIGGSVVVFISLYSLLKTVQPPAAQQGPEGSAPDVGVELVIEEQSPPQTSFYKNIEYVGYLFTALGLFSAADLMLQVFIPQLYNEARWWIEILLVTFGMLAYAIFGSIGRIGSEEESKLTIPQASTASSTAVQGTGEASVKQTTAVLPENLEVRLDQFSRSPSGEYEHKISETIYDLLHIQPDMIIIWREDRGAMRSVYLAGP